MVSRFFGTEFLPQLQNGGFEFRRVFEHQGQTEIFLTFALPEDWGLIGFVRRFRCGKPYKPPGLDEALSRLKNLLARYPRVHCSPSLAARPMPHAPSGFDCLVLGLTVAWHQEPSSGAHERGG
jgi:hypothetical protein